MNQFHVAVLNSKDTETYKHFRLKAFQESPHAFSESFEDESSLNLNYFQEQMGTSAEHFTLGAYSDTDLIGVATFKRDRRSKARHKAYIHTMYVCSQLRGKKIGKLILVDLLARAKTMAGLEQIHLWVLNPETSITKNLYLNSGFVSQGTVVRQDLKINGIYVDAEYMTLRISK